MCFPLDTGSWTSPTSLVRSRVAGATRERWIEPGGVGFPHQTGSLARSDHKSSGEPQVGTALLGARTLLGAPGIATSNKKLLGAPGLTTRSKDATSGSWHRY